MDFSINLYERPARSGHPVVHKITTLIHSLTGEWFTEDVGQDACKDLMFQNVLCAERDGHLAAFLMFTSTEGTIAISLMAVDPAFHRKGFGSSLLLYLFEHVRQMGFTRIVALTVPPRVKPAYQRTVDFYERHGFSRGKEYTELWLSGALQLVKNLEPEGG
ncbi:GNAT family N-acetyltransferase [Paenibacillus aurantius]|uniref:GNAT family N-acetyltransferase n=1 Tax=Paenibacillus aurantius TaxID=2918900 RepID=A0AA96RCL9_9BACL|nr:GNAT family N-acetyltransferase [Paenibacillus aurantius]WNQ10690.1 GNAT family N-acetyltransferase [Paenibacillus aurantius]